MKIGDTGLKLIKHFENSVFVIFCKTIKMRSKKMNEIDIFKFLDNVCAKDQSPIPNSVPQDSCLKMEVIGLLCFLISKSFQNMQNSNGTSNWECDASCTLGSKVGEKQKMTRNVLRKYLMTCQGEGYIEYAKEIGDEIIVKINAIKIFKICIDKECDK
jgi:hypothetical protein